MIPPWRTEQSGPHYWDIRMEAVFLTRDDTFNQQVDFTSLNVNGPIVLSTSQLDFDVEPGFRIMGRYDIGALSVLEFGYMGVENLDASVSLHRPGSGRRGHRQFILAVYEFRARSRHLARGRHLSGRIVSRDRACNYPIDHSRIGTARGRDELPSLLGGLQPLRFRART